MASSARLADAERRDLANAIEQNLVEHVLAHRDVQSFVVEPYVIDRAPKFYVLGGLVLQELRRHLHDGPDARGDDGVLAGARLRHGD